MCEILCHYQAWLLTVLKMGKCVVHQVKVFVAQSVSSVAQSRPTSCDPMDCSTPASLSITNSWSLLKLMSIESVMASPSHPLSSPSPPAFSLSQHQGLFQWVSSSHQVAKVLELQLQHQSFQWIFPKGNILISFRMDWLDLLAVQGTVKSLLQHHSSKASILQHSAFFMVQFSHPYTAPGKIIALARRTFVRKIMSLLFNTLSRFVIAFLPRSKK